MKGHLLDQVEIMPLPGEVRKTDCTLGGFDSSGNNFCTITVDAFHLSTVCGFQLLGYIVILMLNFCPPLSPLRYIARKLQGYREVLGIATLVSSMFFPFGSLALYYHRRRYHPIKRSGRPKIPFVMM